MQNAIVFQVLQFCWEINRSDSDVCRSFLLGIWFPLLIVFVAVPIGIPEYLGLWKDIFYSVWEVLRLGLSKVYFAPADLSGPCVHLPPSYRILFHVFCIIVPVYILVTPAFSFGCVGWCETGCTSATGSRGGHRKTAGVSSLLLPCASSNWTQHLRPGDIFFYLLSHLSGPVYIPIIVVFLTHFQFTNFPCFKRILLLILSTMFQISVVFNCNDFTYLFTHLLNMEYDCVA